MRRDLVDEVQADDWEEIKQLRQRLAEAEAERNVAWLAVEDSVRLKDDYCAKLATAERERDEAREWIAKHYRLWPANSPTAVDLRTELPWLGAFGEKAGGE